MRERIRLWLRRLTNVRPDEVSGLAWAFVYHFALLCAYYVVRPIRDEMGVAGGVDKLQWLFLGTFVAMLAIVPVFGWLTSRFSRRRFLSYSYLFFIANLLLFFFWFRWGVTQVYVARAFFIWVSVFNLFVVSIFWSFMTDIFSETRSKRLFGPIAAGGSLGALTGPMIAGGLATVVGVTNLLLISAVFLSVALVCIQRLFAWQSRSNDAEAKRARDEQEQPLTGGLWEGIRLVATSPYLLGICILILLYTTLATFLYFQQAEIVRDSFSDSARRTAVFAAMDFTVNALTLVLQIFVTGRLVMRLGVPWALALVPLIVIVGFSALSVAPVLPVLIVVQVLRRSGNYALTKPTREMLYVVLNREQKYKAKNFIDTAVYRGGDAVSAWFFAAIRGLGFGLAQTALVAVPLAVIWAWVAFRLGKQHDRLVANRSDNGGIPEHDPHESS